MSSQALARSLSLVALLLVASCGDKTEGVDNGGDDPCAGEDMDPDDPCLELSDGAGSAGRQPPAPEDTGDSGDPGPPDDHASTFVEVTELTEQLAKTPLYGEGFTIFLRLTDLTGDVEPVSLGDVSEYALTETTSERDRETAAVDQDFEQFVGLLQSADPEQLTMELVAANTFGTQEVSVVVEYDYTAGEELTDILLSVKATIAEVDRGSSEKGGEDTGG